MTIINEDENGEEGKELDFNIIDEDSLKADKEQYIRELKLHDMFADAPDELKGIIDEAKNEPIEDLIHLKGDEK